MSNSPYSSAKRAAGILTILSLAGMGLGFVVSSKGPLFAILGFLLTIYCAIRAAENFTLLVRLAAAEQVLNSAPHTRLRQQHHRASLPRKVFLLLFSVAEVDGQAGPKERELVRDFLIRKFQRPDLFAEIRNWNAERLPEAELNQLVHEIRTILTPPECETLFTWCCLVTLIDENFRASEHDILQRIARHLGLAKPNARRLFLYAKNQILIGKSGWRQSGAGGQSQSSSNRSDGGFAGGGQQRRQHRESPPPRRRPGLAPRERALETLGLENHATLDDIRKRHRELVKKHHPDTHSHLGEVAAQEATERFREIQAAYEILTA